MKKVIWLALLTLTLIIAGRFVYERYFGFKAPLSAEEISQRQSVCQAREAEAKEFVNEKARGRRATEPRLFFSPQTKTCILTYLLVDPALPEPETFNSYKIYNFDNKQAIEVVGNYEVYLNKIKELES
jgi:hypothetical protein